MNAANKREHINRLVDGIKAAGARARVIDPQRKGQLSYPYMYGVLRVQLKQLAHDLAGQAASDQVEAAFQAIDDAPDAVPA